MLGLGLQGNYSFYLSSFIENVRIRHRYRRHSRHSRHGTTLNLTPQQSVFTAACFLFTIGLALFFISFSRRSNDKNLRQRCTEKTRGYITNNRSKKGVSKCVDYSVGDKDYFLKINSRKPSKYEVGSSVNIFYNPNKPSEFYIEGEEAASLSMPLFVASGVCLLGSGALIFAGINMGS